MCICDFFVFGNVYFLNELYGIGAVYSISYALGKAAYFICHAGVPGLWIFFEELFVYQHRA